VYVRSLDREDHLQKDGFDYGNTPDFSDREVDKLRLFSVYGTAFLLAVCTLSAALDVANLVLSIVAPGSVVKLACEIQPLALVAIPFSSLSPIADACRGEFHEPSISLIFFSVKLTMALLAFAVLWACWNPNSFRSMRNSYWSRFKAPGGYRKELKSFTRNSSGIMIFLTCCFLLASIGAADPSTRFILGAKFVLEDGLTVAIPAVAIDFIAKASLFILFAWTHRNSGPASAR
jgi:hypothetical protein